MKYLKTRGLPAEELQTRVSAEKTLGPPARLSSFRIEVTAGALGERHKAGVLRAVKTCLIHNTLLRLPAIEIAILANPQQPLLQIQAA